MEYWKGYELLYSNAKSDVLGCENASAYDDDVADPTYKRQQRDWSLTKNDGDQVNYFIVVDIMMLICVHTPQRTLPARILFLADLRNLTLVRCLKQLAMLCFLHATKSEISTRYANNPNVLFQSHFQDGTQATPFDM